MRRNILALSLVALSALVPFTSARIVETLTFADVKAAGQERLTLFHFSTDPKSAELVSMLEEAATQLQALRLPALERFSFAEVDCVKPSNAGECSAAGFAAGKDWLFTSTQASGIQAYTGARTASAVATHVHHKFLPADPALVQTWKDEESFFRSLDGPRAKPVFLKFWEEWCTHCKALKQPFEQMAVYFNPQVTFMELECSRSEISKAFCARHGATSFPTLMLFDGEDLKQKYDGERTIVAVEEFFLSKLTEAQFKQIGGTNAAAGAPAKKSKSKQAKAPKDTAPEDTETAAPAAKKSAAKVDDSSSAKPTKSKKAAAPAEDESDDDEEEEAPKKKKKKSAKKKKDSAKKQKKQPKKKTQQQIEDEEDELPIEDEEDDDETAAAPARKSKKSSAKKKQQQKKKKAQRKQVDEDEEADDEEEEEDEAPKKKQKKKSKQKKQAQKKKKQKKNKKRAAVEEEDEEEEEEKPAPKQKQKKKQAKQSKKAAAAATAGMTQAERRKAKRAAKAAAEADEHMHDEL